ncbi:MAG: sensor histidine kinase [Cyclobacteriaceae bacterium]|nr:sensor histidine kinase [Cyclobacteriaceae bacterium]
MNPSWKVFAATFLMWGVAASAQPDMPADPRMQFDASNYDFDSRGALRVDQGWGFYWKELYTPITLRRAAPPTLFPPGPNWSSEEGVEPLGYGTYRIRLLLPHNHHGLSLYFPTINASSRIWLNGKWAASSGVVSDDPEKYRPELTTLLVPLPDKEETVDVVIQVANFNHPNGGFSNYPRIDRTPDVVEGLARSNGVQNFFAGCLIAMALYQLILFFLYRKGRPFLWLALICLGVAARALVIHGGSLLLPNLFPDVSWDIWKKLEFGSVYAIVAFFPLYVYDLFPKYANRKPVIVFVVLGILATSLVIITTQVTFGVVLELVHLSYLLTFVYAFHTIARAWKGGEWDAKIILLGIAVSFPFILLEIMKNSALIALNIPSMYYVELGVLVFLLFQVYLLANHQALSHKALEIMNVNLEGIVHERTRELRTANDVRDRLLSVLSHDVRSPLNTLQGMLDLYNQGHIKPEEFSQFSRQIQGQLGSTNLLVENILVWTASQLKGHQTKREDFDLKEIVDHNLELFRTAATSKNIALVSGIREATPIRWDKNILHLALRNLIVNAIKFSHEGGTVTITMEGTPGEFRLHVADTGIGMDRATLDSILASGQAASREGTQHERGAGIGLSLVQEYLLNAGGKMMAESEEGKGSRFTIVIPKN